MKAQLRWGRKNRRKARTNPESKGLLEVNPRADGQENRQDDPAQDLFKG